MLPRATTLIALAAMNFIFVDPFLKREVGKHASSCHYLIPKLVTYGFAPFVCSHWEASAGLKKTLDCSPLFRVNSDDLFAADSGQSDVSGNLGERFTRLAQTTEEDLARIKQLGPNDCVYFNSAGPVELMAGLGWLQRIVGKVRPRVIVHLDKHPHLKSQLLSSFGLKKALASFPKQPGADLRSLLKLAAFGPSVSNFFEAELNYPVEDWPFPQEAIAAKPAKPDQGTYTIAILGKQTQQKGFAIVPELASMLLVDPRLVLLVHNNAPHEMVGQQAALRALAQNNPRLILSEAPVHANVWRQFLELSDLVLCPYLTHIDESYSPVLNEAIANGIPALVPSHSFMSRLLEQFGHSDCTFDENNILSIQQAVQRVVERQDHYAESARAASLKWKATQGAQRIVGKLLSWYPAPSHMSYAQNHSSSAPGNRDAGSNLVRSAVRKQPKRVLVSWYCDPSYIPPPVFSENQVTVGPHPIATINTYLAPNQRKRYDAFTPYKSLYDIQEVLDGQNISGPFDAVIVFTESTLNNLPHNFEGFGCPTVLFVGDTHHSEGAITNMVQYATKARFDYVVSTYNRQHLHWYVEAGKERVAWIPALSAQHIPQRFRYRPARKRQLAFAGQMQHLHQRRVRLLEALRSAGLPIDPKVVSREEAARLYSSSVLSFNASLNGDLNLRTFEVFSAGGCLLTDRLSPESGQSVLFQEDRDFLAYSSTEELIEKAERYLDRPDDALAVAASANKQYVERFLPERQAQLLLDWIFAGELHAEYSSTWDVRPQIAKLFPVPLSKRVAIYQTLQEAHQNSEEVRVLVGSPAHLSIAADMIDLPRVRCSVLNSAPELEPLLKQYGLENRISVIDPAAASTLDQWDFLIAPHHDEASVKKLIQHKQCLEVDTHIAA